MIFDSILWTCYTLNNAIISLLRQIYKSQFMSLLSISRKNLSELETLGVQQREIEDIEDFIENEEWELFERLISERKIGAASDFLRYIILREYGGVYLDADYQVLQEISLFNMGYDFYGCLEPFGMAMGNAFIAAKKKHPILKHAVELTKRNANPDTAPAYVKTKEQPNSIRTVLTSGPIIFSISFFSRANISTVDMVFPPYVFFPAEQYENCPNYDWQKQLANKPGISFGTHYWENTWME